MKIKKIIISFIILSFTFILVGCKQKNPTPSGPTTPNINVVDDSEAHYLVFMVNGKEIGKMHVVKTDTYSDLEPYFPTIPEVKGYTAYWEEVEVYSNSETEVIINAYYIKIN